jgi:hypothetical protein
VVFLLRSVKTDLHLEGLSGADFVCERITFEPDLLLAHLRHQATALRDVLGTRIFKNPTFGDTLTTLNGVVFRKVLGNELTIQN